MSVENKILEEAQKEQIGNTSEPTGDVERPRGIRISGGAPTIRRPDHVKVRDQEIDHLQEKTTASFSHKYQTSGDIDPGRVSRYTIRASSDLTITLSKPPAVPAEQRHPNVLREREWDVELIIFHVTSVNVTWPEDVLWTEKFDPDSGEFVAGTPPENPRFSGVADRFRLRYNERTGEWWAEHTHANVGMKDPGDPADDATLPLPEPEEPTDGAPDDGKPRPPARAGTVFALHSNGWSSSGDSGASWQRFDTPTFDNRAFSVLPNEEGFLFGAGTGEVLELTEEGFEELPLSGSESIEFPITNPGFETGDLEGWALGTDMTASVLATRTPPQRPGSRFYLTRDANRSPNTSEFRASQFFNVPPSGSSRDIRIAVDAWTEPGATARLIITKISGSQDTFFPAPGTPAWGPESRRVSGFVGGFTSINQFSDPPNALTFVGPVNLLGTLTHCRAHFNSIASGSNAGFREEFSLSFGNGWSGGVSISRPTASWPADRDTSQIINFDTRRTRQQLVFSLISSSFPGQVIEVTVPAGWRVPAGTRQSSGLINSYILSSYDGPGAEPQSNYPQTINFNAASETIEAENQLEGQWETLEVTVPGDPSTPYVITLAGIGNPADVYFDNVRAFVEFERSEVFKCFARDLEARRHVIATEDSIWEYDRGAVRRIGPVPIPATTAAAAGELILLGSENTGEFALSDDNGASWRTWSIAEQPAQVFIQRGRRSVIPEGIAGLFDAASDLAAVAESIVQIIAPGLEFPTPEPLPSNPDTFVILTRAETDTPAKVYTLDPEAGPVFRSQPAGTAFSRARMSYDERRLRWIATLNDGKVVQTTDLLTWTDANTTSPSSTSVVETLPMDNGRWLTFINDTTAQFYTDSPGDAFTETVSLTAGLLQMQELK